MPARLHRMKGIFCRIKGAGQQTRPGMCSRRAGGQQAFARWVASPPMPAMRARVTMSVCGSSSPRWTGYHGQQASDVCGFGARDAAPPPMPATVIYITVDSFPFPVYGSHVPLQASSPFVIAGLLLPFFSLTSGSPLLAVPAENNGHCAQSTRKAFLELARGIRVFFELQVGKGK